MSDRINHVEQARHLLDAAHKGTITETSRLNIVEAQVHATLALVEQQRIANLLSVYSATRLNEDGTRVATRPDLADRAFGTVLEALGLS